MILAAIHVCFILPANERDEVDVACEHDIFEDDSDGGWLSAIVTLMVEQSSSISSSSSTISNCAKIRHEHPCNTTRRRTRFDLDVYIGGQSKWR